MLHALTIVVIALTLIACSDGIKEAKQMIKESIGPNSEFELRNVRTFPGEVVCGEYLIDKRTSAHPFIAVRDMLYKNPGKLYSEFFCSEAPANVLQESTGIGPYNADNSKLGQITNDFSMLVIALESYYHDYASYPTIEQGLQALASPPDNPRSPTTHSAESYLKAIPLDPWGRPYLYQENQWGGSKGNFTITTLGANGIAGGTGDNADSSTRFLVQLQHMAFIVGQQTDA